MKIFITDGSSDAFFTAVFYAFAERDCLITSDDKVQLSFDSEVVRIDPENDKCQRVINGIEKYDRLAEEEILLVLRSCDPLNEQTALEYIRKIMQTKAPVRKMLGLPEVIEFNDLLYKVRGETHRMKGFLRFMESRDGALYAPFSPDNDITDLLMAHFAERMNAERFVIHDVKRKIAGMYDGREWIMARVGEAEVYLSEYERAFENLWKKYYKAVNIESRPHIKQMKGYMPVRYWKFLPEKRD